MIEEEYSCDGQMTFDECLREMETYKWKTGQYMNLPETEGFANENNGLHPTRE